MQTANRLFYSKDPIADDNEPIYLRQTRPSLIVRLLVFFTAFVAGCAMAWFVHMIILWVRHPEVMPDGVNALGGGLHYVLECIRNALYR